MKSVALNLSLGFCIFLLFTELCFCQQNPRWPYKEYGGELVSEDSLVFKNLADFSRATFDRPAAFNGARFDDTVIFWGASFNDEANFRRAKFAERADFGFNPILFIHMVTPFATFADEADFSGATFDSRADFTSVLFHGLADFSGATFNNLADFRQTRFEGIVRFFSTNFRQGVDFRQSYFDSVQTIYLENTRFPEGKFRFYWDQFKAKDNLRIKVEIFLPDSLVKPTLPFYSFNKERYTRIEIIYHRLRDNFLAQDDKASADAVMYELGWQRKEILGELRWKMYDIFFGYGFQPWRLLLRRF